MTPNRDAVQNSTFAWFSSRKARASQIRAGLAQDTRCAAKKRFVFNDMGLGHSRPETAEPALTLS
jgi:hypothetical protein